MRHALTLTMAALLFAACDWSLQRMVDQPRCEPDEPTSLLNSGSCDQPPPADVRRFALSELVEDAGAAPGEPIAATPETLARGRQLFTTFCVPCHGVLGDGVSQVAENMEFRPPPSLHEERIVGLSDADLVRVIAQGYGLMPAYGSAIREADRWAVVSYVRVLELSQNVALEDLPPQTREEAQPWLR